MWPTELLSAAQHAVRRSPTVVEVEKCFYRAAAKFCGPHSKLPLSFQQNLALSSAPSSHLLFKPPAKAEGVLERSSLLIPASIDNSYPYTYRAFSFQKWLAHACKTLAMPDSARSAPRCWPALDKQQRQSRDLQTQRPSLHGRSSFLCGCFSPSCRGVIGSPGINSAQNDSPCYWKSTCRGCYQESSVNQAIVLESS